MATRYTYLIEKTSSFLAGNNRIGYLVLLIGVILVVLAGIFPPWYRKLPQGNIVNIGYGFILGPVDRNGQIDYGRLFTEWFIIALLVVAGFLVLQMFRAFSMPTSGERHRNANRESFTGAKIEHAPPKTLQDIFDQTRKETGISEQGGE